MTGTNRTSSSRTLCLVSGSNEGEKRNRLQVQTKLISMAILSENQFIQTFIAFA